MKEPEPAAPAVGEDEALLARIDSVIQEYLLSSLRISQERAVHKMEGLLVDLGTRLRTALADVEIMEHNARVGGLREEELERERDEARAALAAAMAERDALAKRLEFHDSLQAGIDEYNRARAGRNDG